MKKQTKKQKPENGPWLVTRLDLKLIVNIWTFVTICLFSLDFFSGNRYDSSAGIVGAIYLALLGIYVGDKEYVRWKTQFYSRFYGEIFVGVWTFLLAVFSIGATLSSGAVRVPAEFAVVYTTVVGIYAISSHSKHLKSSRK